MLKSVSSANDDVQYTVPDVFTQHNEEKVHILLDEAGTGKSTYFTWLAHALSIANPAHYVIRINDSQYCTDYKRWQNSDIKLLDDTAILRCLYRLIHLTHFVSNVYSFWIKATDVFRNQADRAADLFTLVNGKIYVNTRKANTSKFTWAQLIELKIFQEKFNQKQLIILFDGLDETAPFYKEFVVQLFARVASLEGIRTLFISTRPYDYIQQLESTFSNNRMYCLKQLSQYDQLQFVHNYLMHELEDYTHCDANKRHKILGFQYHWMVHYLKDLKRIPLLLHMACVINLPIARNNVDFKRCIVPKAYLIQTNANILDQIEDFIKQKLKILSIHKAGLTEMALLNPHQQAVHERFCENVKKRHILSAMLVMFEQNQVNMLLTSHDIVRSKKIINEVHNGIEKTGIITGAYDGIPQFTHRIFAEYFAACWMNENKQRMRNESFFHSWSFWIVHLHKMRDFFNRIILQQSKGCDLHMAVVNQSTTIVSEILSKNPSTVLVKDDLGRYPLHLAVTYPSLNIVNLLLDKMSVQSINTTDHLFGWSAIDYAFAIRCIEIAKKIVLTGATVNEHILLQQILSNNLYQLLYGVYFYGEYLQSNECSRTIANRLLIRVVDHILNKQRVDIFSRLEVLDSKTVLEFCITKNFLKIFKQFVLQINDPSKISDKELKRFARLALENNAHDVIVYLIEDRNIALPQMNSMVGLISALKYTIQNNKLTSFKAIFHHLCIEQNILMNEETDIPDDYCTPSMPPFEECCMMYDLSPEVCCVLSCSNVRLPLPEYDEKDILYNGYVLEALLAYSVHEGNVPMLRYIHLKTKMAITNRLIAMIMRLLPKGKDVCHKKSMPAFLYLLDNSTDLDGVDDEGRNLLHMTAQNGCFFMMHCLIVRGFHPATVNAANSWNVFHYVAFNEEGNRSNKILEYLLKCCNMIWFDLLDNMLHWNDREIADSFSINLNVTQDTTNMAWLTKQQYGLLAWLFLLDKRHTAKVLNDLEHQEAHQCMNHIVKGNHKTLLIKEVRDDIPQFTHRIFAEYFAACWLNENKNRMKNESFFFSWSYWNNESRKMRDIFNRVILRESKGCDLHMAVINQSPDLVRELLSNNQSAAMAKDTVGRMPLHLAVTYQSLNIVNLLLKKMSIQYINTKDHLLGWSVTDYAFASRYSEIAQRILAAGATVDEHILLQQILSNQLSSLLCCIKFYGKYLRSNESSRKFAESLNIQVVENILNEKRVDIFSRHDETYSKTVLEFCISEGIQEVFKQFVWQINDRSKIFQQETNHLFELALENDAHDIIVYFIEDYNIPLPHMDNMVGFISALKYTIQKNKFSSFKAIFHHLCIEQNILMNEETDIPDGYCIASMPSLDEDLSPEVCCVLSCSNVRFPLPEYDEKDILYNGYVLEALLAYSVHEGNVPMLRYIHLKTKMAITNRLIAMIMRLLPKGKDVCHKKSMPAFLYLLDNSTDLDGVDDEGRNLLHMTAQNGCFFMMHCLIVRGFHPATVNAANSWNVFHYVAFNEEGNRSNKILEYLLKYCNMTWFDLLDNMLHWNDHEIADSFSINLNVTQDTTNMAWLTKQQYGLLAWLFLLDKRHTAKVLNDLEHQEAHQCMNHIVKGNHKTLLIKEVRDDIPQFTHRIFAEYFAACWLNENKNRMKNESFFFSWSYWNNESRKMRDIFNRVILRESKGCDLHMAVINQSPDLVRELLSNNQSAAMAKDTVGRMPLHLAASYPLAEIENVLLNKMSVQSINTKDHLLGWSATDYAFASRYRKKIKMLLSTGATVNEQILFAQIISNNMRHTLTGIGFYVEYLQFNESSRTISNRLSIRVADYILNTQRVDIFSSLEVLDSKTVLEFCLAEDFLEIFKQFVFQINDRSRIFQQETNHLFELALENDVHDIIVYLIEDHNIPLPHMNNIVGFISALKYTIQKNKFSSFKAIFHHLCIEQNILMNEETDIPDGYCIASMPSLDEDLSPEVCCVLSCSNVRLPLPEYDEKDILYNGYVLEALLAYSVHEGNVRMLRYIHLKTKMAITNRLIAMIMRLLPKGKDVCHKKSMPAFLYLLDNSTDLDGVDDEGRNLLHMTAQNGCFFMMHCLIVRGFHPATVNAANSWNVFHYVAFNEEGNRSNKILEYLLKYCNMTWFDLLDNMLHWNDHEIADSFSINLNVTQDTTNMAWLTKQQYGLLAWLFLLDKRHTAKVLNDLEHQEAYQCMNHIVKGNHKTLLIKEVRDDIPQFTHRIFAEYFAACWLNENKNRMKNESFFFSWSYWNNESRKMRDIFNRVILRESKGCDLHMAVINQSPDLVRELLSNNQSAAMAKDTVGRMPLHLAASYPLAEIENVLLNKMSVQSINTKDHLLGWSVTDYAFASRYRKKIKMLLSTGATVNEQILFAQIISNNMRHTLTGIGFYVEYLQFNESSRTISNRLSIRVADYILNTQRVDIFSSLEVLDSKTVLEFCLAEDFLEIFKQFVFQINDRSRIFQQETNHLFELALENDVHDIIVYLIEDHNIPLPHMNNIVGFISALKYTIQKNKFSSFKAIFHHLCIEQNILMNEETDIPDGYCIASMPSLDEDLSPEVCCVLSCSNVRLPLPEYDEKDILYNGYVLEALLAYSVHEGNVRMLRYIHLKTKMAITNRLIAMIMRLLPKGKDVCHKKSMPAFLYLLDNSTDLDGVDDEGRNLLHMTAQNGCFFMMHCLIVRGFHPATVNAANSWNAFHYVAFNEEGNRSNKILEYLLKYCNMIWFDLLDNMLHWNDREIADSFSINLNVTQDTTNMAWLTKQQYGLLAWLFLLDKRHTAKVLNDLEHQEAHQCMNHIVKGNHKTLLIKEVRDDIPQFTHRIFAEYFAACWLNENKNRMKNESFFFSWSYWNNESRKMRDIFNRVILRESKGCDLHMAVINQSPDLVRELLSNNQSAAMAKDTVGRMPLHLAASYPLAEIENVLLNKMSVQSINTKDHLLGWSVTDYAFASRYRKKIKMLLSTGATVNEQILFAQIISNNMRHTLTGIGFYVEYLQFNESSRTISNRLSIRVADYILNTQRVDIFSSLEVLDSKTVLEFCLAEDFLEIFKQFVFQINDRSRIFQQETNHLFELALENDVHDIIVYLIEDHNIPLPHMNNIVGFISALKYTIQKNKFTSFKAIFHHLCIEQNILMNEETDIPDGYCIASMPSLDEDLSPEVCCVLSCSNVRFPLPEYDEKDILYNGYVLEALLAYSVHEGNVRMLRYIHLKTKMAITNRLIAMIMRLLPKGKDVCHKKSMPAFLYLLDNSTDLDGVDDEGRNLLHMTAQNGCFFMMHCLIVRGFHPATVNAANSWNAFHYVAFNEEGNRSNKILEYLLKYCNMIWFDLLDNMLHWNDREIADSFSINLNVTQDTTNMAWLTKQQYGLLAWLFLLDKRHTAKVLNDLEHQEAYQCMNHIVKGNHKTLLIKEVRDDIPQFTHRIFAEYFAACWLNENKNRMKNESFFFSWSYWNNESRKMLDIFNRVILRESKGCDLHMAVINQSPDLVRELLSNNQSAAMAKDTVGRMPLHLAASYPLAEIENVLLNKMSVQSINTKDHLLGWSATDYAFASRYRKKIKMLLSTGATVNEQILFAQIISNNMRRILTSIGFYVEYLQFNESSRTISNRLSIRVADYILNTQRVDIFSSLEVLDSKTVLEFCLAEDFLEIFKQFVFQINDRSRIFQQETNHLFELALENDAHDIIVYLIEDHNIPLPHMNNIVGFISALKYTIQKNKFTSFKAIFHHLCIEQNILMNEETDIPDGYCIASMPSLDEDLSPEVCCVLSCSNVRFPLPEYDEKDILYNGYVLEALLAYSVHEGNVRMLRYIHLKTKMAITNRLIAMIMRLLPKGKDVCHKKSMPAFLYLLDNSTDLDGVDDEGRNLLHMTAQNGCFFMMHCLIVRGFHPATVNAANS
ncbi:uncharacterized protein LOC120895720 isoform X1 [Anopheles arabiensis]|uniref:uncharacterized protein LOC120895720 isoform X1 n=1 Tax=Anopheles arabiensis TaxID=7173 RepID=UPI001AACC3DA|nr:uncharacterized protein LOC120895720 isoform X1 [Anopheles arabiensis]